MFFFRSPIDGRIRESISLFVLYSSDLWIRRYTQKDIQGQYLFRVQNGFNFHQCVYIIANRK